MLGASGLQSPPKNITAHIISSATLLFSYNFTAVILSITFLTLSVPIITLLLIINFEKTKAQEYAYFIFFLAACLTEITRLFIPIFGLWDANSSFLISMARLLLCGRTLAPITFLFPALISTSGQNSNTGRNIIILLAVSGLFSALIPVNTAHILPDCTVETGYRSVLRIYTSLIYLLSFVSFLIAAGSGGREQRLLAIGYALLFAGYLLLINMQSIFIFVVGVILFTGGVYIYLSNLHKLYMWK
jgi:hypothetical protein